MSKEKYSNSLVIRSETKASSNLKSFKTLFLLLNCKMSAVFHWKEPSPILRCYISIEKPIYQKWKRKKKKSTRCNFQTRSNKVSRKDKKTVRLNWLKQIKGLLPLLKIFEREDVHFYTAKQTVDFDNVDLTTIAMRYFREKFEMILN